MNKEYILSKIKPYVNANGMITEETFNNLFSRLSKRQQYEIINILIDENIDIDYDSTYKPVNIKVNTTTLLSTSEMDKLTNEQLCVIYQRGQLSALEVLVRKNSKFVWSRVRRYSKRYKHKLDDEDLFQYGNIGLIEAAKKFDVNREFKFTTYSTWWVDQKILRSINDYGFTVRIPVHFFEQVSYLLRVLSQNSEYDIEEIVEVVSERGVNKEKLWQLLIIAENIVSPLSLNTYVNEDEDTELGNLIRLDTSLSVEEEVLYIFLRDTIIEVLNTLTDKEKDIIEQRYGLRDGISKTLEQIGKQYNVTRERIRQIEKKAIKKLRHPKRSKKLKGYYRGDE